LILTQLPKHGLLLYDNTGSFNYRPETDFAGHDTLFYRLQQGNTLSAPARVVIHVQPTGNARGFVQLFPNPATDQLQITAPVPLAEVQLLDAHGRVLGGWTAVGKDFSLPVADLKPGTYWLQLQAGDQFFTRKFIKIAP
jgi:hypothetical protein